MNPFFAALGMIFGFSGAPSFAVEPVPPPTNGQVSLESCFLASELEAANRLIGYREVQVILKDRDYQVAATTYNQSYACELYSDLYEHSVSAIADWDTFLYDNQSLVAVREIMLTAEEVGTTPVRLWVLSAVLYDRQQMLGDAVATYIEELKPPE